MSRTMTLDTTNLLSLRSHSPKEPTAPKAALMERASIESKVDLFAAPNDHPTPQPCNSMYATVVFGGVSWIQI